jgi:drug/metabolite transporter (DMT)-like permease
MPALETTLAIALCAAPLYLPVWWLALPSRLGTVTLAAAALQMVFQGVFAVIIAGILYTRAVNAIGAANTTLVGAAVPVLIAVLAWPLLGESFGPAGAVGILLVSAGMLIGVGRGNLGAR